MLDLLDRRQACREDDVANRVVEQVRCGKILDGDHRFLLLSLSANSTPQLVRLGSAQGKGKKITGHLAQR